MTRKYRFSFETLETPYELFTLRHPPQGRISSCMYFCSCTERLQWFAYEWHEHWSTAPTYCLFIDRRNGAFSQKDSNHMYVFISSIFDAHEFPFFSKSISQIVKMYILILKQWWSGKVWSTSAACIKLVSRTKIGEATIELLLYRWFHFYCFLNWFRLCFTEHYRNHTLTHYNYGQQWQSPTIRMKFILWMILI